jgi:hypothetical protein
MLGAFVCIRQGCFRSAPGEGRGVPKKSRDGKKVQDGSLGGSRGGSLGGSHPGSGCSAATLHSGHALLRPPLPGSPGPLLFHS